MSKITIYTTTFCPYCDRAKALLTRKGLQYEEINAEDQEVRSQMMVKTSGKRTVPQIFVGQTYVGGSDDLYALENSGKLDNLLIKEKIKS